MSPQAAHVFIEELSGFERIGLVDPNDQYAVAGRKRVANVLDELTDAIQDTVAIGLEDMSFFEIQTAVLTEHRERALRHIRIGKGGDDRLVEDPAHAIGSLDDQPPRIDIVQPVPDISPRLADDALTLLARGDLA